MDLWISKILLPGVPFAGRALGSSEGVSWAPHAPMGGTQYVFWLVPPGDLTAGELIQVPCMIRGGMHTVSVPDGAEEGEEFHTEVVAAPAAAGPKAKAHSILRFAAGVPAVAPASPSKLKSFPPTAKPPTPGTEGRPTSPPVLDKQQVPWRRRASRECVHFDSGKQPGDGVMVACSFCSTQNNTKMATTTRAMFDCAQCGRVVQWRPRQVWLRDQGRPLEMGIHPQPGEERAAQRKNDIAFLKDIVSLQLFTKCLCRPQHGQARPKHPF